MCDEWERVVTGVRVRTSAATASWPLLHSTVLSVLVGRSLGAAPPGFGSDFWTHLLLTCR